MHGPLGRPSTILTGRMDKNPRPFRAFFDLEGKAKLRAELARVLFLRAIGFAAGENVHFHQVMDDLVGP